MGSLIQTPAKTDIMAKKGKGKKGAKGGQEKGRAKNADHA